MLRAFKFQWWISATLVVVLLLATQPPHAAAALTQGSGAVLYGEGTLLTPEWRKYTPGTNSWSAEATLTSVGSVPRQTIIRTSPVREEAIAGMILANGTLQILKWNGFNWSQQWTANVGLGNVPRFDIVYEQNSGEAMVAYSKNVATTNELAYRLWNGTSWGGESLYDAQRTSGAVQYVKLASRAASNDVGMAWGDANFDLSADWWDSSTDAWDGEPLTALSTNLSKVGAATALTTSSLDLAFEQSSGNLLVAWGNDAVLDLQHAVRLGGMLGVWGAATTTATINEEPTDIRLAPEPDTNYIAYANITDNGGDAEAVIWNGTAWGSINNFDITVDTVATGTTSIDVAWLVNGANSRAVVVYDDANAAGLDWLSFNKTTSTWTLQTDYTAVPAPAALNDVQVRMTVDLFTPSQLVAIVADQNLDLFAKRLVFDGTNLTWSATEPGAVALEATLPNVAAGWAAGYAYFGHVDSAQLSADIVDASDASVVLPAVGFTAAVSSPACQSSTATLGVAAQKIRVRNTTATPGWTISIAASGGVSSSWSSGVENYDFNDPAGCADSGDADSLGGQLSVNPSSGSLTPEPICTTSNVSLGSSSGFAQGVTDSITLLSANSSAGIDCYWDLTGVSLSQQLPGAVAPGSYEQSMTITAVAN